MPRLRDKFLRRGNASAAVELDSLVASPSDNRTVNEGTRKRPLLALTGQTTRWTTDLLAWIVAFGCLVAIAGVLQHWNDRPVTEWKSSITLNTVISILATFLYLFVMVPVSSCIAQLKWNCFYEPRPLFDFDLVDQASRSAFASARLALTRPLLYEFILNVGT